MTLPPPPFMFEKSKRIEIVIDVVHLPKLISVLENAGLSAYTVIPEARGKGDRGQRNAQDPASVESNSLLIAAVPCDKAEELALAVRPVLARYGGLCLVSDGFLLQH